MFILPHLPPPPLPQSLGHVAMQLVDNVHGFSEVHITYNTYVQRIVFKCGGVVLGAARAGHAALRAAARSSC